MTGSAGPAALAPDARARQMGVRLSALALILYGQGRVTGDELSRKLSVNLRTIYRDVTRLQQVGLPIVAAPGPGGGFAFDYEAIPDLNSSTDSRFLDLFERVGVLSPEDMHAATFDHVLSIASDSLEREDFDALQAVRDRVLIDRTEWYTSSGSPPHFDVIRDAVFRNRKITVTFSGRDRSDLTSEVVEPYGMVWKGGAWYMFALSPEKARFVRVRLERILDVTDTGESFERDSGFNLRERWEEELENFGKGNIRVVIRIAANSLDEFSNFNWKQDNVISKFDDHWLVEMMVDRYEWLIPLILSYGGDVTVIEPEELRDLIGRSAIRLLQSHQTSPGEQGEVEESRFGDIRTRAMIHRQGSAGS